MTAAPELRLEAPDVAGTIDAWRAWVVLRRGGDLALAGVVYKVRWPPGEPLVAGCLRHAGRLWARLQGRWPHDAPGERCTCGAYATDVDRAASYLAEDCVGLRLRVFGEVALWGTVVECEQGWRASHAYPKRLYVASASTPSRAAAAEIAQGLERYGVPVELVDGDWDDVVALASARAALY